MRIAVFSILIFFSITHSAAAQTLNAGFVQGIWYSEQTFFAGDTVRVYVALQNNSEEDLVATVQFFDNGVLIGERDVDTISGRLIEAWTDWEVTSGDHDVTAVLKNVIVDGIGTGTSTGIVVNTLASDALAIDIDSDGDDIGNIIDEDDDNDGIPDEIEKQNGTNPLVFNQTETVTEEESRELSEQVEPPSEEADGLEALTESGPLDDTFTGLTHTINTARDSLLQHQEERSKRLDEAKAESGTHQGASTTETIGNATVTRSQLTENTSFLDSVFSFLSTLFTHFYSFVLALLIFILGYPALLQIAGLFFFLIIIYRFARKLGGRRPE